MLGGFFFFFEVVQMICELGERLQVTEYTYVRTDLDCLPNCASSPKRKFGPSVRRGCVVRLYENNCVVDDGVVSARVNGKPNLKLLEEVEFEVGPVTYGNARMSEDELMKNLELLRIGSKKFVPAPAPKIIAEIVNN